MLRIIGLLALCLAASPVLAQDVPLPAPQGPEQQAPRIDPLPIAETEPSLEEAASDPNAPVAVPMKKRVVRGTTARLENARWQAQIFAKGEAEYTPQEIESDRTRTDGQSKQLWRKEAWENHHRCGGVLIARDWILTAAHCAKLPRPGNFLQQRGVRLGTLNLTAGGQAYRIERVAIHRDYDPVRHIHDIALMRIVPDASSNSRAVYNAVPIRILGSRSSDMPLATNTPVLATGWGLTGEREHSMTLMRDMRTLNRKSPQLKQVALMVLPQERCEKVPSYRTALIPEVLCIGTEDGRDTCNGDSGGPITRKDGTERVLVGLVSFGYGCGIAGVPGLYVNVPEYRKWIADAMREAPPGRVSPL